jgi:hypothetical protein
MDTKSNKIRTILLLKINSEIDDNNNKIEFKSISKKKNVTENYKIEFNEFYQGYEKFLYQIIYFNLNLQCQN